MAVVPKDSFPKDRQFPSREHIHWHTLFPYIRYLEILGMARISSVTIHCGLIHMHCIGDES